MRTTNAVLTSDGAGIISTNVGVNTPASTNNFSELSAVFDLYRIKRFSFYFFPFIPNGSSSTADYRPVYMLYDADANAAPISTVGTAVQYATMRSANIYLPIVYSCVPQRLADGAAVQGGWINVGAPSSIGQFQIYGNSFDLSTTYGTYYFEYQVEFRNVR